MKALSAMIAVILLVGLTVGIGGLISIFITDLTQSSTKITSNQSESLTKCAGAYINVYSVDSDQVFYTNPTSQTITGITITFSNGTTQTNGDPSLTPGETNNTNISTIGSNTFVIVRGLCQSIITAEGKCKNTETCWNV